MTNDHQWSVGGACLKCGRLIDEVFSGDGCDPAPENHVVMDEEDRTPAPEGYDAALWQKADEVCHSMALVADDTECVKIVYAALATTKGRDNG